jgi:hypothetical protein
MVVPGVILEARTPQRSCVLKEQTRRAAIARLLNAPSNLRRPLRYGAIYGAIIPCDLCRVN